MVLILSGTYACHEAACLDLVSKSATCADSFLILQASGAVLHTSSTSLFNFLMIHYLFSQRVQTSAGPQRLTALSFFCPLASTCDVEHDVNRQAVARKGYVMFMVYDPPKVKGQHPSGIWMITQRPIVWKMS